MKIKTVKQSKTQAEYAEAYGISRSTVRRWIAARAPLDDPKLLKAWVAQNRTVPKAFESRKLKEAQMKKIMLECDRLTFHLNADKEAYISKEETIAEGVVIKRALDSALDRLLNNLPPLLPGLDEAGMSAVIERETNKLRQEVADELRAKNRRDS